MKSLARTWLVAAILIALLAPILANDAPVVAVVKGDLRFPALSSYLGAADHGLDLASTKTWQDWWLGLPEDSNDWAVMPPIPFGPLMERDTERRLEAPSLDHWLGTDTLGRDVLSRLIWVIVIFAVFGITALAIFLLIAFISWLRFRERRVKYDSSISDFRSQLDLLAPGAKGGRGRRRRR